MILRSIALLALVARSAFGYGLTMNFRVDRSADLFYGTFEKAGVVTENTQCSHIGNNTLAKGGSAADAIIAVAVCTGVVNGCDSGIGGGLFLPLFCKGLLI